MSITLDSGVKLQGKAGAATAIVVTVYGLEVGASAYKRLAQVTLGTGATAIYTAPASGTIISTVTVQSIHASDQTTELWVDASGTADANRVFKSTGIPAGGGADYDGSRWNIRDAAGRPLTGQVTTSTITAIQTAAAPAPTVEGEIWWDTDDDAIVVGDGAASLTMLKVPTFDTHANRLAAGHKRGRWWRESDTGLIYYDDGTNWVIVQADGQVRKTADETVNNSAALQNDDHLKFPIEANEVWLVEAVLICLNASANSDYLVGWTGPAGASADWGVVGRAGDLAGSVLVASAALATNPAVAKTLAGSMAFAGNAGRTVQMIAGVFVAAGTAGTIQFQWAQNTATAENTQIMTNSSLRLRRLA